MAGGRSVDHLLGRREAGDARAGRRCWRRPETRRKTVGPFCQAGPVSLAPYRQVLSMPGVARLLIFAVLARVPAAATAVVITLHVVTALGGGYGAAGLVATVATVAMGVGFPWRGRAVDRTGLRRALAPSVVVAPLGWALSPLVDYPGLLVLAVVGGLFAVPTFTVVRQSLSVMVPPEHRRTAFSLDGMGTEVSFMIGPAVGVLVATQVSTRAALLALAAGTAASGLALMVMNPPTRSPEVDPPAVEAAGEPGAGPVRWLTPALAAVLASAVGATVVLAGSDVAVVAYLREHGAVTLTGVIFVAWGIGSMIGGLVYGSMHREVSPFVLLIALALLTVPVGLAPGPWTLLLTILPAAALCAPLIAATAEGVSRLIPEAVRGEVMGWHGSALQAGSALGAPLAGVVMDAEGAWSGFVAVGVAGAVIAAAGLLAGRRRPRREAAPRVEIGSTVARCVIGPGA
jgi:MFS family permease